jgi:bifunctional non-homologous end joining protein LigD
LTWQELEAGRKPGEFTVKTVPQRLETLPRDPWADYFEVKQSITKKMLKAVGID